MTKKEIKRNLIGLHEATTSPDCREALERAIELVERDISKKLESEVIFVCPSCGMEVENKTMAFCQNCGQRFGGEEEE